MKDLIILEQYFAHSHSSMCSLLLLLLCCCRRKKERKWEVGEGSRRGGGGGRKIWGLLLFLCPPKHLQILLLLHQLLQDGSPLAARSGLQLVLHVILFSLSLFHHQLTLIPTKDGLTRVWLKHGQLQGLVLYLKQGHT